MTRAAGLILIAVGALLILPQIVVDRPAQILVVAGVALGIAGAALIAEPEGGTDYGR